MSLKTFGKMKTKRTSKESKEFCNKIEQMPKLAAVGGFSSAANGFLIKTDEKMDEAKYSNIAEKPVVGSYKSEQFRCTGPH